MSEQPFFSCRCGNTVWRGDRPRFVLHIFERREDGGYNDTRLSSDNVDEAIADLIESSSEVRLSETGNVIHHATREENTRLLAKVILAMDSADYMTGHGAAFVRAAEEYLDA